MHLSEKEFKIPVILNHVDLISHLWISIKELLAEGEIPVRFVITRTDKDQYQCELGSLMRIKNLTERTQQSIFDFVRRKVKNVGKFNAVLLVPTGIGAEIGGYARRCWSCCQAAIIYL